MRQGAAFWFRNVVPPGQARWRPQALILQQALRFSWPLFRQYLGGRRYGVASVEKKTAKSKGRQRWGSEKAAVAVFLSLAAPPRSAGRPFPAVADTLSRI